MKRFVFVGLIGLIMFDVTPILATVVKNNFFELKYVQRISKFRSGAGHDYSYDGALISAGFYELETDPTETNRSMKHYFNLYDHYLGDNTTVPIYSPFDGAIYRVSNEGHDSGFINKQVWIQSHDHPNYYVIIHHVNLSDTFPQIWNDYPQSLWPLFEPDDNDYDRINVSAGEQIGFGDFRSTESSDIAFLRMDSTTEYHYVSYFATELMSDPVFSNYQTRGVPERGDMIISKDFRDNHPVDWWGSYNPDDWVELNAVPIPGTLWLIGSGLVGLVGLRKKRKK